LSRIFQYKQELIMKRTYIAAAVLACAATPLMAADYYYYYPAAGTAVVQPAGSTVYYNDAATISVVQQRLLAAGYSVPVDGYMDSRTIDALRHFQQTRGFAVTGAIDQPTIAALGLQRGAVMSGSVGGAPVIVSSGQPVIIRSDVGEPPRNYDGTIGDNHGGLGFDRSRQQWGANY
jgi:peptidoglycan hydrolase-like protein with peptidoglycan-binding domain